jgi:alkanesulfonate monooxygenase SsuD/methylene tetrahydromethanopterin reductase-like flavin-dependent oxidoreductase (luciferase family)
VFVVLGSDNKARAAAETGVREQIAFYGSTPAYRPVLDLHGWGDLHEKLNLLSRRQEWSAMGELISDDVLNAFAIAGDPAQVAAQLMTRFGDIVNRISVYTPYTPDTELLTALKAALFAAR